MASKLKLTARGMKEIVDRITPTWMVPRDGPTRPFSFPRDHHDHGEAWDIAFGGQRITHMIIDDPMARDIRPIDTAEIARMVQEYQEYQDRISRSYFMDMERLGITAASMIKSHRPDRPPSLAAPSSKLPSYRPR